MELQLKPTQIPFMVGDTVVVNQPYDHTLNQAATFQGQIIQIILDGSLPTSSVVRNRQDIYQLVVSSVVYDLKPLGNHQGLPRVLVAVQLLPLQRVLFGSQHELADYENSLL